MFEQSHGVSYGVLLGMIDEKAMPAEFVIVVAVYKLKLTVMVDGGDDEVDGDDTGVLQTERVDRSKAKRGEGQLEHISIVLFEGISETDSNESSGEKIDDEQTQRCLQQA